MKELKEKAQSQVDNERSMKDVLSTVLECFDCITSSLNHKYDDGAIDNDSIGKQTFVSATNSKIKLNTNSNSMDVKEKNNYDKER